MILDEPFAALDKEKEGRLIHKLEQMRNDRIVIVTSHRKDIIGGHVNILNL